MLSVLVSSSYFLSLLVLCVSLLPFIFYISLAFYILFPVPVPVSCPLFPGRPSYPVSLVKCCFGFRLLLFVICYPSSVSFQSCFHCLLVMVICFIWLPVSTVFVLSPTPLLSSVFVPCYLWSPGLCTLACWLRILPHPIKTMFSGSLFHFTFTSQYVTITSLNMNIHKDQIT